MAEIQVLPTSVANQIAAGEVVERPASIVKELIENAVDSGARRIEITIVGGGLEEIIVVDDGSGMSSEDARLAFHRHATSKLRTAADLFSITSLGFRGEALPSIASVADIELITRRMIDESAFKVHLRAGRELAATKWGAAPGTQVRVRELFHNTPARYKFLKSAVAEGGRIRDQVTKQALANPQIAFRLLQNDRIVLETPGNDRLGDTIMAIFGRDVMEQMIPLERQAGSLRISGFLSRPELTRNNRRDQVFVVNGRFVDCRFMSVMLQEAYRSLLPKGRHPLAVLALSLPHEQIDVNVHPAKTEVRFSEERQVASILLRVLRDTLEEAALHSAAAMARWTNSEGLIIAEPPLASAEVEIAKDWSHSVPREEQVPISFREFPMHRASSINQTVVKSPAADDEIVGDYRILGQVLQSYIIVEKSAELWIIDQHAAHERIIYEELTEKDDESTASQLLIPYTLNVSGREAAVLQGAQQDLASMGFLVEPFGGNAWVLRSIPSVYRGRFHEDIFFDLLADWAEGWSGLKAEEKREKILIRLACVGAIKAGERLHGAEMAELLEKLWRTKLPFTCPHGRPTALKYSEAHLYRLFHP